MTTDAPSRPRLGEPPAVECHTEVDDLHPMAREDQEPLERALAQIGSGSGSARTLQMRLRRAARGEAGTGRFQGDLLEVAKASRSIREGFDAVFGLDGGGTIIPVPFDIYGAAQLLLDNSWHARCCELKADVAGGIDWRLDPLPGQDDPPGTDEVRELFGDPSSDERQINDLARLVIFDRESLGNGYLEVGRVGDWTTKPNALYHVPALMVRVATTGGYWQLSGKGGAVTKRFFKRYGDPRDYDGVTGQLVSPIEAKQRRATEADEARKADELGLTPPQPSLAAELIHFKQYHPLAGAYGIPSWIAAALAMRITRAGMEYNADRFEHQNVPNKIIVFYGMVPDEATRKKLADYFEVGLKGRAHRPLVLSVRRVEDGQKIEIHDLKRGQSSVSEEGDFLELGAFTRDETIMVHGVPPSMLGVTTPGKLGGKGDSETARRDFKAFKIEPAQTSFERTVMRLVVVDGFGMTEGTLIFKLMDFDLSDHEFALSKSREMRSQVGIALRTINEARKELGLPLSKDPVADELWIQTSSGPLLLSWIDPKQPPAAILSTAAPGPSTDDKDELGAGDVGASEGD